MKTLDTARTHPALDPSAASPVAERNGNDSRRTSFPLLIVELLIVLTVHVIVYAVVGLTPGEGTWTSLVKLSWLNNLLILSQIAILRKSYGSVTAPVVLFTVFLALFTSGQLILLSFGVAPTGADVLNREAAYSVLRATAFYLTAFAFFCSGCLLRNELRNSRRVRVKLGPSVDDWQRSLLAAGALCAAVGVVPFAISNYHNFRVILTQGYSAYYAEGARLDSPLVSLSYLFITGLVFVAACGRRGYRNIAVVLVGMIAFVRLAAGDRGEGLIYLLTAYLLWKQFIRSGRAGRLGLVAIVLFALVAIPTVGALRQSFGQAGVAGTTESAEQLNPVESTLDTMGATLFPLVKVTERVPSTTPFVGGATYVSSVIRLVPSSLRPGRMAEFVSDPLYSSPATWLMNSLNMSYGPGFTPFAEAYLNFGWWIGSFAMFLFGLLFSALLSLPSRKLPNWPLRMALVLATFALLGFTVRGSFNLVVPFLIRYVLLPGGLAGLFANGLHKRKMRTGNVRDAR